MLGFSFRDPCGSYMDLYPDDFIKNMLVYEFRTYHMCFIHNEYVKLNKTYIDIQGGFYANLSNVIDVLGHLTSKLHEHYTLPMYAIITNLMTL